MIRRYIFFINYKSILILYYIIMDKASKVKDIL